ncbi:Hypothetical predicted protein [Mytilus galloprovincialis]|uniref:B box-type domain-containing protein n=1 Tax=Mytilus galloprovincialis TaxID=29158 RepID=A0A8B6FDK7_MYTGA|nr:Hypothetical predicted protein [Mytilus galloprovincialis]
MEVNADHTLISVDQYRYIRHVPVNLVCDQHDKNFDLYCKTHDEPICRDCFSLQHKQCSDVVMSFDEATKNAKQSTAFAVVVDSIDVALVNMEYFINNRYEAVQNIELEEHSIRKEISKIRFNVNKHLDELEKTLFR